MLTLLSAFATPVSVFLISFVGLPHNDEGITSFLLMVLQVSANVCAILSIAYGILLFRHSHIVCNMLQQHSEAVNDSHTYRPIMRRIRVVGFFLPFGCIGQGLLLLNAIWNLHWLPRNGALSRS